MQYESLRPLLKELRFNGMLAHLDESMALCEMKKMTPTELMQRLLEIEVAHRQTRSLVYRLTLAQLPQVKSLDHFEWSNTPISQEKLSPLTQCQFITQRQNLLLVGGSGTGKTHIALALAHKALQDNLRVKFYSFSDLARQLLKAKEHRYEQSIMARLQRFHLLVIDELGYLPIDQQAGALLFELFSKLYEKTSLIITTHLTFDEWAPLFGNAKASKAIVDRITHHCVILETGNKSWRLKEGTMAQN